ncbi:glycosyltransferase family 2 protein [Prevotella melaninogenica]|uniref:glycosyltransferase family 2 protein n=1 Tax=Prevotella melaninogenica TaxID=28132 RepID=UPI0028E5C379|nr:glycosyltransferase family 2 protein [Prevotella melaninogenica]
MCKVSIIVPVYNCEGLVGKCINSILSQTFTDFELIIVDDGSKDSSLSVCQEIAKDKEKVKVYTKPNGGANSARRFGVSKAKGEYISFVDSDDVIPHDSIEKLIAKTKIGQLDIIQAARQYYINGTLSSLSSFQEPGIYDNKTFIKFLFQAKSNGGPHGSLYKRSLFGDETFNLPREVVLGEDFYMNLCLGIRAKKVGLFNDIIVYEYHENQNSVTHNYSFSSVKPFKSQQAAIKSILEQNNLFVEYEALFYAMAVNSLVSACLHNRQLLSERYTREIGRAASEVALSKREKLYCLLLKYPILYPLFLTINYLRKKMA